MNQEKQLDRRVRRTRHALRGALLELIHEKGFDALTVTEIAERADLRRATFYLHYTTKEALLLATLEETFDELIEQSQHVRGDDVIAGRTKPEAYLVTFEHVAQNADLYQKLFSESGGAVIQQHIRAHLAKLVLNSLEQLDDDAIPFPREVVAHYIAGTELALILWWLDAGMPHSTEDMAHMAHQLVFNGVPNIIGD